jgi:phage terminase small subunit
MEHEYFEGVDWDNLPTYYTALSQLTPFEVYLRNKCEELKERFEGKFKETPAVKETIYNQ